MTTRCFRHRPALAVAALLLLAAGPAAAKGPLERTAPDHMAPVPPGRDLPMAPPITSFALPPQWVTIRSTQDWRRAGKFEKELSRDCTARRFCEIMPLRFRAYFKGEVLGVAFGHGLNLYDPKKKADRKLIYLFRDGDATNCTVLSITNEDARVLNDAQPDAGAGAKAGGTRPAGKN